jgi:thymidylate synthase (FAD)
VRIIHPSTEICNLSHDFPLQFIEEIARTCYKSEEHITEESAYAFVKNLIKNGHEAMLEHVSVTVKIICDRGVSHELVRHRVFSFLQESTR